MDHLKVAPGLPIGSPSRSGSIRGRIVGPVAQGWASQGFLLGWLAPGLHVDGLDVAAGFVAEHAEDVEAGVIAVAEVMEGEVGRESLEEGEGP